jgi:hypothetical protein
MTDVGALITVVLPDLDGLDCPFEHEPLRENGRAG